MLVFFPASKQKTEQRELAAQRVDTLLGFDLVPITVTREINGRPMLGVWSGGRFFSFAGTDEIEA